MAHLRTLAAASALALLGFATPSTASIGTMPQDPAVLSGQTAVGSKADSGIHVARRGRDDRRREREREREREDGANHT